MTNLFAGLFVVSLALLTVFVITFVSATMIGVLLSLLGLEVTILEHALVYAKYSTVVALAVAAIGLLSGRLDIRTEDEE